MAEESLLELDPPDSYSSRFSLSLRHKSSTIPGATEQSTIYSTSQIVLHDTLIAFLSYVKTFNIPILPVTKPDIRTVLGQGASFLVNGCEVPKDYVDPATGNLIPQGTVVAMKRARVKHNMIDKVANRIGVIYNELLTMNHPPLSAHPNIVNLLGVGFETEGPPDEQRTIPVLFPECAELGNLADVLETARKEERPLAFEDKISLCLDVAHGLEILHACDIVHGDVKLENVLVFANDDQRGPEGPENFKLQCKLTDFGAQQLPGGDFRLGGSRPWQAPEIMRESAFRVEEAKRTDIYGFGMLVWRTFLDGDPFKSLGQLEGTTTAEQRTKRNELIAKKKSAGTLVAHVCESLALSEKFSKLQLNMLCDVIRVTLLNDAKQRELHLSELIRKLSVDGWYQERHPVTPSRMHADPPMDMIDIDKWYSEFEAASPVVQADILAGFRDYALSSAGMARSKDEIEKKSAAAYQLAICCANGFGGRFRPEESLRWLTFAAEQGSQKAQNALSGFREAFPDHHHPLFKDPFSNNDDNVSNLSSSWGSEFPIRSPLQDSKGRAWPTKESELTWLGAAQTGNYTALNTLLETNAKPSSSADGVSPLHFLSSWDTNKAKVYGQKLVQAGANVNAIAARGATVGGTPLMWAVHGDHIEHSMILLDLGAQPMRATSTGEDALSFAAKLHLADHLRLLLEHIRPADVRGHLRRLLEAAAGGGSRFTRISRHGAKWKRAAVRTFDLIREWNQLFPDAADFRTLVVPAVRAGALSPYGRVNTDAQIAYVENSSIEPSELVDLLRESLLGFNRDLFVALLRLGVPIDSTFENGRNLLHLCARIPDHSLAATAFAPSLLKLGIELDRADDRGLTPWMDAVLERKWDLTDLFLKHGADPLKTDIDGFNIIGLCIQTVNLGALKFLLKYTGDENFKKQFFLVNQRKQITSLQLAASLPLPRAHGMRVEVMGTFLTILSHFGQDAAQINFRSDGICPRATALDIAASKGIVHAVRHLVKRDAILPDKKKMAGWAQAEFAETNDFMKTKNLERCRFIIENYERDPEATAKLAADWTNLKTIDESKVDSSWENVSWDYSSRRRT